MYFTGADLGRKLRRRKDYVYSDSDRSSDGTNWSDDGEGRNVQLAFRDKEEVLVEKALQRIQRAQELGKKNVRLSQSELDALQRKRQSEAEREMGTKSEDRRRSIGFSKKPAKENRSLGRKMDMRGTNFDVDGSRRPPGILVPGPSGGPSYAPLGYHPPANYSPQGKSSRSGSRLSPEISRSRHPRTPPSNASTRSLPDDPNWIPRPRSSSSLSNGPYSSEPYNYQAYSPPLHQTPTSYRSQERRIVSSPQPDTRKRRPRHEDPGLRTSRREHTAQERQDERTSDATSETDDDNDEGVQVEVVPGLNERGYDIRAASEGSAKDMRWRRQ